MTGIKIDFIEETIIMNSAFAKKAKRANSPEYRELIQTKKDFPTYKLKTRTIKRNTNKECYKGLTYNFMREYIAKHYRSKENIAKFEELINLSKCHSKKYPTIKKWFLETYPEVTEYNKTTSANEAEVELKKVS
jgi:hypothetical protein